MMFKNMLKFQAYLLLLIFIMIDITNSSSFESNNSDPFAALGIPDLSPKKIMEEIDTKTVDPRNSKTLPQLKSMDDLPNFLKMSNVNEDEAIKILTRFLIQDDFTLKKYGVVYDQTGFDGLGREEIIAAIGTEERLNQRAKSSANIWFKDKYPKLFYEAYGVEQQVEEIVPNWRVFKVLMIGSKGETTYLKVCLPLDESETALVGDKDEPCLERANFVDKEKEKNEDYINKIKTNNFFKKKKTGNGMVKLLPGEKMIAKDKNKSIVLDSHSLKQQSGNGFLNPPNVDGTENVPYLAAIKNKKRTMFNAGNNGASSPNKNLRGNISPSQFMQNPAINAMNMNLNLNDNNFRFNQVGNHATAGGNNFNNNQQYNNYRFNSAGNNVNMGTMNKALGDKGDGLPPMSDNTVNQSANTMNQNPADPSNMSNMMNEFKLLKEQMMMLQEQLKQKDEIIKQQNSRLQVIKPDAAAAPGNMSLGSTTGQDASPAASTNPDAKDLSKMANMPAMPPTQNIPGMPNINGMASLQNMSPMSNMQVGMNGYPQNFNPMMNQYNNYMPNQMGAFNPNLGRMPYGMNGMMPNQMGGFNPLNNRNQPRGEVL